MSVAVQVKKLLLTVCLATLAPCVAGQKQTPASASAFAPLKVSWLPELVRVEPAGPRVFAGYGRRVEVRLRTRSTANSEEVDVFEEQPVTVMNLDDKSWCEVNGRGWARQHIYLSSDENFLLLGQLNGAETISVSYDLESGKTTSDTTRGLTLVLYDIPACRVAGRVDVAGNRWDIQGKTVRIGEKCTGDEIGTCASVRREPLLKSQAR